MKRQTNNSFLHALLVALILLCLTSGGADAAERSIFEVVVENDAATLTTSFLVRAESPDMARQYVTLNGWKVLSVTNRAEPAPLAPVDEAIRPETNLVRTPTLDPPAAPPVIATPGTALTYDMIHRATVYFNLAANTATLGQDVKSYLVGLDPARRYVVIGYTDEIPVTTNAPYKNNFDLSLQRARFVRQVMIDAGIPENRIEIAGMGPAEPIDASGTSQPKNRRVDVYERQHLVD